MFTGDQNYKTGVINISFYGNSGVSDQLQVGTHGVKVSLCPKQANSPNLNVVELLNCISKFCLSVQSQLRFIAVKL